MNEKFIERNETYLVVELICPAEGLVVEEAAGAPVPDRALLLLLVRVEHIEEGEQVTLGHLEVPLGHPRLVALARRLHVHVLNLYAKCGQMIFWLKFTLSGG